MTFPAIIAIAIAGGCRDAGNDAGQGARHADRERRTQNAEPPAPLRFTDVTAESGIDMILTSGELPSTQIIEVKGNGLALIDYNNNGRLDLFVPNGATMAAPENGPGWRLFENLGDMRFRDVSEQVGITQTRWAFGAAVGDFTGNGFDDIYVTCYGPNLLLRNTGDGRFEAVSSPGRVDPAQSREWSTSAAWGDVTANGWLDLYVANYIEFDVDNPPPHAQFLSTEVFAGPFGMTAQHDVLLGNDGGELRDISESSGIRAVEPAWGLGVVILDFDNNGRQDIYVGNDSMRNFLFHNQGAVGDDHDEDAEGRQPFLIDIGMVSGIGSNAAGANQATMGIGIADVTGNGLPDVFTSNFSSDTNTLHVNVGSTPRGPLFEDRTTQHGVGVVSRPYLGWACGFYDLDLDGSEELLLVNGHIYPQATRALMDSDYKQPPLLFKRERGKGSRYERITDASVGDWLLEPRRDRAVVFGDLNNNGLIDVVIGEMNGPIIVLRNDSQPQPPGGNWLIVELRDDASKGLGSRVELFAGAHRMTRWIYSGGFLSANPAYAHFGVPRVDDSISLRITWPDGSEQHVEDVPLNQRVTVTRKE